MEKKPEGKEAKGFSGLDSMLSDVDETIASLPKAKAPEITQRDSPVEDRKQSDGVGSSDEALPGNFSTSGKWFAGILVAAILFGLVFGNVSHKDAPATVYQPAPEPPPVPAIAPAPVQSPSQNEHVNSNAIIPPGTILGQAPSRREQVKSTPSPVVPFVPAIEKPPVGTDLVLSTAQMRYCITEKIKVSAIKPVLNRYASKEVDDFNAMISDFNSRCGSYRYREGTLEGIRSEVESRRGSIEHEAKRHWVRQHVGVNESPPKPRAAPKTSIPAHSHIDYLGHDWECNHGYRQSGNECVKLVLPAHARVDYLGHDWECNHGYRQSGNECVKLVLPAHARVDYLGHDWECNHGYRQFGNECVKLVLPAHASVNYLGHDWECNRGYVQVGNQCEPVGKH